MDVKALNNDKRHESKKYWLITANPYKWLEAFPYKRPLDLNVGQIKPYEMTGKNLGNEMQVGDFVLCFESKGTGGNSLPKEEKRPEIGESALVCLFRVFERDVVNKRIYFQKIRDLPNHLAILQTESILSSGRTTGAHPKSLKKQEFLRLCELSGVNLKEFEPMNYSDILGELLMDEKQIKDLLTLIKEKQNVILQGAPGVGKTFVAKRLAYLQMLENGDITKLEADVGIEMIQFHQNYSYEDFIRGFKPTEDGRFVLQDGVFYSFCEIARTDPVHDYFFIIDEINRGNLSKILGEMMMLIEKNHRGEELKLTYRKSEGEPPFSVPKNVYILGMMNTADRSLAMIDYALRRRFSFYPILPAFESDRFEEMFKDVLQNSIFSQLISQIIELNKEIRKDFSLTEGCCIGHSYFCDCIGVKDEELKNRLQRIVKYDVLPILEEYWFDDKDQYEKWREKLYAAVEVELEK